MIHCSKIYHFESRNSHMASAIKLVVTDMDGTIVATKQHTTSEAVRSAVIGVEQSGVQVAAVTARPYEFAKSVFTVLGIDGLCVVDGGATVVQSTTGEVVWSKWLDADALKKIVAIMLPHTQTIDYKVGWNEESAVDVDIEMITDAAPYVYAEVDVGDVAGIFARLNRIDGVIGHAITQDDPSVIGIQVCHYQADKFHGVSALRDIVGLTKDQTLAIGDGDNDLSLFQNAAVKVAMGNATDKLKSQADYIVGSLADDGFAEAMQRFVL
ncbi:MAG: HAD family phosphatase [Chloroflexi bacterium]|nr:MAG: HAD family phosphatase [Chloroflexota bacterium]